MLVLHLLALTCAALAPLAAASERRTLALLPRQQQNSSTSSKSGSESPYKDAGYQIIPATLPELPYALDALEPTIGEETMKIHYAGFGAAIKRFNAALTNFTAAVAAQDTAEVVRLTSLIAFNGGAHINHFLFFKSLAPSSTGGGSGSFPSSSQIGAKAAAVQGSGWVWVGWNGATEVLQIETTKNQDILQAPLVPLLGIDLFEHAFFLDYQSDRAAYVSSIFAVVNWAEVERRLVFAQGGGEW
ncbi:hypothetical protein JCM10207_007785 [Rhodosporidiobolus poonsookiae]